MARTPQPWFWARRGVYLVTIKGVRHNLGADKTEADRLFHELMARKDAPPPPPEPTVPTAVEVFDKFLSWCQKHREKRTFEWYRDHIQDFVTHSAKVVAEPFTTLRPYMVVEWADTHPDWGTAYRRGGIIAIQRPFNWAEKLGYIAASPIKHIEKPKTTRRDNAVTAADWKKIKAHYPEGDTFLALLEFSWESGCRPQESKRIEARHVQLLAIDEALTLLAAEDPAAAEVVKLRFFAGLTAEQAADALSISLRTANSHWAFARAWLFRRLGEPGGLPG